MTYRTFELLIAWDGPDFIVPKWVKVCAIDKEAAFADVCEMYAEQPRLVMWKAA